MTQEEIPSKRMDEEEDSHLLNSKLTYIGYYVLIT